MITEWKDSAEIRKDYPTFPEYLQSQIVSEPSNIIGAHAEELEISTNQMLNKLFETEGNPEGVLNFMQD